MNDQIISRCPWGDVKDKAMQEYHDHEWAMSLS